MSITCIFLYRIDIYFIYLSCGKINLTGYLVYRITQNRRICLSAKYTLILGNSCFILFEDKENKVDVDLLENIPANAMLAALTVQGSICCMDGQ